MGGTCDGSYVCEWPFSDTGARHRREVTLGGIFETVFTGNAFGRQFGLVSRPCARILGEMRGDVAVRLELTGIGSRFEVWYPCMPRRNRPPRGGPAQPSVRSRRDGVW